MGDIILFRRKDYQEDDGPPGEVYSPEWNKDHTQFRLVPQTELVEGSPEYIHIRHRIIAISEKGLVTKGDNNAYQDFLPVQAKDYEGKIVWHMNHINWLFKAMYRYGVWMGCTMLYIILSFYLENDKNTTNAIPNGL